MLPDVATARANATRFWRQDVRLPHSRISVPDSGIQYLLDASIRNLYQIGEFVDGGLEFHPGPSVYRGLWVHDAFWHLSSLLYLGDAMSVKLALDRILSFQLPSGQVRVMAPYVMNRETPIVAHTMFRYARMTDDRGWLLAHWDQFEKALSWTEERRKETLVDRASPAYGLFPPGFADGGLGGIGAEYASVYWALVGFRSGWDAAMWLKKPESARHWQACYDDLMSSFRRAAARDLRKNASGHWYLPVRVADTSHATPPQQANWPLLDAQGLAHLFDPRDSLVSGTLAMLSDDLQEGLPTSTGWLKDGLWPFFGSLLGITQTFQRDYPAAHRTLYAVANHASPLGTWVEEQLPKAVGNTYLRRRFERHRQRPVHQAGAPAAHHGARGHAGAPGGDAGRLDRSREDPRPQRLSCRRGREGGPYAFGHSRRTAGHRCDGSRRESRFARVRPARSRSSPQVGLQTRSRRGSGTNHSDRTGPAMEDDLEAMTPDTKEIQVRAR